MIPAAVYTSGNLILPQRPRKIACREAAVFLPKMLLLLASIFFFFSLGYCQSEKSIDQHLQAAEALKEQGKYNEALAAYSQAIKLYAKDPKVALLYFKRGSVCLEHLKQYSKAAADYSQALALEPNNLDYCYCRGMAYYRARNWGSALKDFEKIIQSDKNYRPAETYYYLGYCYHKLLDYGQAIRNYTKAIGIKPDAPSFYIDRGAAYFDVQNYPQAKEDWLKAKEFDLSPKEQEALNKNLQLLAKHTPIAQEQPSYTPKKLSWAQKYRGGGFDESDWDRLLLDKEIEALLDSWSALGDKMGTIEKNDYALMRQTVLEMSEVAGKLKDILVTKGEQPAKFGNIIEKIGLALKSFMEGACLVGEEGKRLQQAPQEIETAKEFLAKLKEGRGMMVAAQDYLGQAKELAKGDEFLEKFYGDIEKETGEGISSTRDTIDGLIKQTEEAIEKMQLSDRETPPEPLPEEKPPLSRDEGVAEMQQDWEGNLLEADRAIGKGDFFSATVSISTAAEILSSLQNTSLAPEKLKAMQKISFTYELVNGIMQKISEGTWSEQDKVKARELLSQASTELKEVAQEQICQEFSRRLKDRLEQAEKSLAKAAPKKQKESAPQAPRKRGSLWERMKRR